VTCKFSGPTHFNVRAGLAELALQRHRPLADGAVEWHGDEGARFGETCQLGLT